jgi:two-component system chemotaxis response regulator CheB
MIESFTRLSYNDIICVVLTGMGRDGTDGILDLKKRKKIHVITQSADTCVVYGMPKACDQAGLSNESVPIDMIAGAIAKELGV